MSEPRSVMFVAPSAYLLSGLATWLDYLLPALQQRGWDATLALVSGRKHHLPAPYLREHPNANYIAVHTDSDTPVGRRLALEAALLKLRPDIAVSVNIPDLFVAINRLRQRVEIETRAVMSVHGIEHYLYADILGYRDVLDGVICTNRLSCALAVALGEIDLGRVLYASYGVMTTERAPVIQHDASKLRIVYSGRIETPQKRCMDLAEIAKNLRLRGVPFQMDIVGDGPDREKLADALHGEIARGEVVMHGYLPAAELRARIYAAADAMIITSSWETGPIVAWEAMAQGIGVVSSRYVGHGQEAALEHGVNAMLFDIGDTHAAAEALERLWRQSDLRTALQVGGSRLVESRYSVQASTAGWEQALGDVAARSPMPHAALPSPRTNGRLDRWVGVELAEQLRRVLRVNAPPAGDPGGEWPHANNSAASDAEFWECARMHDSDAGAGAPRSC